MRCILGKRRSRTRFEHVSSEPDLLRIGRRCVVVTSRFSFDSFENLAQVSPFSNRKRRCRTRWRIEERERKEGSRYWRAMFGAIRYRCWISNIVRAEIEIGAYPICADSTAVRRIDACYRNIGIGKDVEKLFENRYLSNLSIFNLDRIADETFDERPTSGERMKNV